MKVWRSGASIGAICALSLVVVVSGCNKKESTTTPAGNSAKGVEAKGAASGSAHSLIGVTLSPDIDRPLKAGSSVKLSVTVEYMLPSQGGRVGVVVQDSGDKPAASVLKEVPGGVGKFVTELDFKVAPASKSVRVSVPLYVKGETKSSEIIDKEFTVER